MSSLRDWRGEKEEGTEQWRPSAYEYRTPPALVRDADIPKTKGKGSGATGKSAGASKGASRKSRKAVA